MGYESIDGSDFIYGSPDVWLTDKSFVLDLYMLEDQIEEAGGIDYWSLNQKQKEILCRGLGMNINLVTDELVINRIDYIRAKYSIPVQTIPTFIDEAVFKGIIQDELSRQAAATWKLRIPLYLQSIEANIQNKRNGYVE